VDYYVVDGYHTTSKIIEGSLNLLEGSSRRFWVIYKFELLKPLGF